MMSICVIPHNSMGDIFNSLMMSSEFCLPNKLVSGKLEPEHKPKETYALQLSWALQQAHERL